jgi:hypothetical protein
MIRTIAICTTLFLLTGCTAYDPGVDERPSGSTGAEASVGFRTIAEGSYGAGASRDVERERSEPAIYAARTEQRYRELWREHVGNQELPPVDFGTETVVFLIAGIRSTGGYAIEPRAAHLEGDQLTVEAPIRSPGEREIVTQAFTYPFAVLAVPRRDVQRAEWQGNGRTLGRSEMIR